MDDGAGVGFVQCLPAANNAKLLGDGGEGVAGLDGVGVTAECGSCYWSLCNGCLGHWGRGNRSLCYWSLDNGCLSYWGLDNLRLDLLCLCLNRCLDNRCLLHWLC